MGLIVSSLALAPMVALRMFFPLIGILIGSIVVWSIAGTLTLGYSNYISEAVTSAFITLFGIRVALDIKGDKRRTDYRTLMIYSVVYGIVLAIAKNFMVILSFLSAMAITEGNFSDVGVTLQNLGTADENVQTAFILHGWLFTYSLVIPLTMIAPAMLAVPMAAIAQSSGHKAHSQGLIWGFCKSILPLFAIFVVSYVLQFALGFMTLVIFTVPLFILMIVTFVTTLDVSVFDLDVALKAMLGLFGIMCLQSWLWSASALALLKAQGAPKARPERAEIDTTTIDLRSLRKSRE